MINNSHTSPLEAAELESGLTLLGARLRGLMISLSVVIFFVVAWLVPTLYERASFKEKSIEAALAARSLASSLSRLASSDPVTWVYRHSSLQKEAKLITETGSYVQVANHKGVTYLINREGVKRARHLSPVETSVAVGVAPIEASGARGEVRVYLIGIERLSEPLWLIAILLGALTSLLISIVPLWLSREGDERNRSLWRALQELNHTLEQKISQRTAELDEMNTRLVNVQEEERARISRDLHDELGQTLTAARLQLTTAQLLASGSEEARAVFEQGLDELDQGVELVRSIAYALRPPELDALGLEVALTRHVTRRAKGAGLIAHVHLELPPLQPALSTTIFRVVQEGLTNVIRHARATSVQVKVMTLDEETLRIDIHDDGVGLPPAPQEGVGLLGLRSRAREHGGAVRLIEREGGLTLQVTLKSR